MVLHNKVTAGRLHPWATSCKKVISSGSDLISFPQKSNAGVNKNLGTSAVHLTIGLVPVNNPEE